MRGTGRFKEGVTNMLTIGEFSKRGKISPRMLRHYDAIGLLHPVYTADNGYRYYDPAQLSILKQIETLKGYGFPLKEIGTLLPLSEEEMGMRLHARRLDAYGELNELRKKLRQMEADIAEMEGTGILMEKYHVIVMNAPAQKVFCLRRVINVSETHSLFAELLKEMEGQGLTRTGTTQQMYLGEQFSYDAMDVEAQVEVLEDGPGVKTLPAGMFAAVTHVGPYETLQSAYEAVQKWFDAQNEYEICGPSIERYIKDENMVKSPEELETGILFPVRKTGKAD
ncbi:MerR family transcriptional regulator [Christensenella intestinihominis]|uniref:MerR family transcriptional regulator n=2 Tax=Christensenella intestinihominis TaxID=1851429 RepID=UPI0022E25281|nr:MerR family transcriptional regulator [Christensenella intestinihominis]